MKKTSSFQNSLIWFGAAVSIAEILTGTYFAPLGFTKGLLAILVGHVIGCAMFFFAGLIGGRTGRSAMGTVELSFGRIGCLFFAALIVTVIGTICAICFPMDDITNFLYLIGSVFAPMIAIQITDFFLLKRGGASGKLDVCNAVVWVLGFVLYRVLMTVDIPVGNTLPDMAGTMLLCLIAHKIVPDKVKAA